MDRISQLPDPILQRILCHLSPKDAFRSCVLSKSWRHICSTRPKFELCEDFFKGNREAFFSFLDTALSRYRDQNSSLPEFLLEISSKVDSEFVPILEAWIPVVLLGMGVKELTLIYILDGSVNCGSLSLFQFHLAAIVFKAESLEGLYITGWDFSRINHTNKVMFKHLRKLSLTQVCVSGVTLERIISSCPLIEHVTVIHCFRLGTIKVNKAPKLKCFDFEGLTDDSGIEIDLPSIECIRISNPLDWIHSASYLSFTHLKSLYLSYVRLSENSFHRFSVDFCCLEELTLRFCYGFREFKLLSSSIKSMSLYLCPWSKLREFTGLRKATIDVPNIHCFELSCASLPSISFTTASNQWVSKIIVNTSVLPDIYELYKAALRHSEFSLHITENFGFSLGNGTGSPVVVENLTMDTKHCIFSLEAWLGYLFCFFRPRNIQHFWYASPENEFEKADNLLVRYLREFLVEDKHQGLEQVLVESSIEQGKEAECGLLDNRKQKIRFRLKWRE